MLTLLDYRQDQVNYNPNSIKREAQNNNNYGICSTCINKNVNEYEFHSHIVLIE